MDKYYAIVNGTFVVPLTEISGDDMDLLNKAKVNQQPITAVPVYFSPGKGVWPMPANGWVIAKVVDSRNI